MKVWVTRTQPGASKTASALKDMRHEPVVQPVLEAQTIAGADIDLSAVTGLAFTSGQAVSAFARHSPRRDLPVFAVGDGTAAKALSFGFTDVVSAQGDARDLVQTIKASGQTGPILWPRAEEPAADLVALLAAEGVACRAVPVYRTVDMRGPAPEGIGAIVVHSPRGAAAVARVLNPVAASQLILFAISENAAAPLRGHPFRRVAIAPRPDETALLALITG